MVTSIDIGEGILRNLWGERVEFTEGLNVICGPNGSGKTLLLDTIAHYTFIQNKGWSKEVSFGDIGFFNSLYDFDIIGALDAKSKGGKCRLDWDGVPVFKTQGIIPKQQSSRLISEIMCGCTNKEDISYNDLRRLHKDHLSNGQSANLYIDNLLGLKVPDLLALKSENKWRRDYKNLVADHVFGLLRDGKPTILIDEIDGVLDTDNLYKFWKEAIPKLEKKYQVIVVTHNPIFVNSNSNIIGKNYYKHTMELYGKFSPSI